LFQAAGAFNNGSVAFMQQIIFDDSDSAIGTGYSWTFVSSSMLEALLPNAVILAISAAHAGPTAMLGPSPVILSATPLRVPFNGNVTITVTSSVWNILSRMQTLAVNRTATCQFALWGSDRAGPLVNTTVITTGAVVTPGIGDNSRICLAPEAPPFCVWNVTIILADSRSSSNIVQIGTVCPNNYFIQEESCAMCPSDENGRSFNEIINAPSIESCRCSPGSYGTFGPACRRCPPLEGFNCSLPDQAFPIIQPGFYGDYSLLSNCDLKSVTCAALKTCPFGERACPGGGEQLCVMTENECYAGRACSYCCPMYYLENSICNKCPDASTSGTILAVMAAVALVVALLLSTSSSPSFTQSVKYLILGMSFVQNLVSIKLISIDWPAEFLQMFNILSFFSFSIGAVRPECSFSWSFEIKIIFSLLLPMIASIIIGVGGVIYGVYACRRLFKRIQALRADGAKLPQLSFTSLVNCWLHVLLFRPVQWKTDLFMWFALSPYLESRVTGRRPRAASENWGALRSALRSKFQERRVNFRSVVFGEMHTRKIHPMGFAVYDVKELQAILHAADLDTSFASAVFKGRKFASGVFSILVLFFVGSLTSSIGALLCEARDDAMYLVQDPTIECNYESARYISLVAMAVFALCLYVVVVPIFLVILLRSEWSKDMRTGDRSGYDALFGFLTSRYSLACYMWESVMFVYKGFGVLIPAVYSGNPLQQCVGMMFVSLFYVVLLFRFSPFANSLMNAVEKSASFSVFLMYFVGVIFVCEIDGSPILDKTQKSGVAVLLVVICGSSAVRLHVFLFCFGMRAAFWSWIVLARICSSHFSRIFAVVLFLVRHIRVLFHTVISRRYLRVEVDARVSIRHRRLPERKPVSIFLCILQPEVAQKPCGKKEDSERVHRGADVGEAL
jgi:hypothetical protein